MIDQKTKLEIQQIARAEAEAVYKTRGTMFNVANVPRHIHNGEDSLNIPFESIQPFKEVVYWTIPGIQAATATNYGVIWIAPANCFVTAFQEVHQTAGTDGGAVTLQLEKLTGTTAPNSGIDLLTTALSLKATINTVQDGTIVLTHTATVKDASLNTGDRLCLKDTGTLTAVANVTVAIFISYKKK